MGASQATSPGGGRGGGGLVRVADADAGPAHHAGAEAAGRGPGGEDGHHKKTTNYLSQLFF